ncbi:MAG: ATP-dependent Clp protease ATP-binding subunit ClpA [Candidatus Hydrogenedentes bacterium]|nr:ATP-dependent Clp protease ATP-binding subunit ClpA [Candidatus Hydrogenedentota bacterium]
MISKDFEITLSKALREARARRHEYLCVEHLLYAMLNDALGGEIIENCGGDLDNLKRGLEQFFKDELQPVPEGSPHSLHQTAAFERVMQRAIMHVQYSGKEEVDAGDILASMLEEEDSFAAYYLQSEGITRLDVLNYIAHGISKLDYSGAPDETYVDEDEGAEGPEKAPRRSALEDFTVNLNERAAAGAIDPLIGRRDELRRTIRVLSRRRKNNPVFVGEPGVGKTALAEGLALHIHNGQVPPMLRDVEILSLDLAAMLAGTKFRGEFEQRLKAVLHELRQKPKVILYIDEIHTVIGAGATSESSMDASTILKPALASGELRCIGSTTYEEYKNRFEKDRAFARRFQKIDLDEPSVEETVRILRGLKDKYEEHHGIQYADSALRAAAELSARHINDRFLPDKAIDVIDEAGATVMLEGGARRKRIQPHDIELIVSEMAKIPARTVSASDKNRLATLEADLLRNVFGQDAAIRAMVRSIKRSRAGLGRAEKPIGCFLFTGPTGVGKTELARQLAAILGNHFAKYDMSEYMEKHAVSRLIGAPPGYVGFDQGGLLVDEVRRHPYTVLLLDEIEKAHPDLFNILLQVMDSASLTDNQGKKADFRNVILIMTSNAGARELSSNSIGFQQDVKDTAHKSIKAIEKTFTPEFRNRLDAIIPFANLPLPVIEQVVDKFISQLEAQLMSRKVRLTLHPEARQWLAEKGYDPHYGARPLARLIEQELETPLSDELLFGRLEKGGTVEIVLRDGAIAFDYGAVE